MTSPTLNTDRRSIPEAMTLQEIAEVLSAREGKHIHLQSVWASEKRAMKKLREALAPLWVSYQEQTGE